MFTELLGNRGDSVPSIIARELWPLGAVSLMHGMQGTHSCALIAPAVLSLGSG